MTPYQKLEKLDEYGKELIKWKKRIGEGEILGNGTVEILERLITKIVLLKVDLGIKIKL